jgi:hypothetical protein
MTLLKAARYAVVFRHLLEELAGRTLGDIDTTDIRIAGSAPATQCSVSDNVRSLVQHNDPGYLANPAAYAVSG